MLEMRMAGKLHSEDEVWTLAKYVTPAHFGHRSGRNCKVFVLGRERLCGRLNGRPRLNVGKRAKEFVIREERVEVAAVGCHLGPVLFECGSLALLRFGREAMLAPAQVE